MSVFCGIFKVRLLRILDARILLSCMSHCQRGKVYNYQEIIKYFSKVTFINPQIPLCIYN